MWLKKVIADSHLEGLVVGICLTSFYSIFIGYDYAIQWIDPVLIGRSNE